MDKEKQIIEAARVLVDAVEAKGIEAEKGFPEYKARKPTLQNKG